MKSQFTYVGVALVFGLICGYILKADNPIKSIDFNTIPVETCVSQSLSLLKATDINTGYLQSLSDLCYSRAHGQALLYDFQIRRLKFIQQTYDERILLWMVVAITISGVGLAALQLLTSYNLAKSGNTGSFEASEFSLEKGKIALRSSVTGLFVLIFSFAFFYVFVYEIYIIKEIKAGTATPNTVTSPQPQENFQLHGPAMIINNSKKSSEEASPILK